MWKAFDHEIKTIEELFLSSVPPQTGKEQGRSEKQMYISPEKSAGREQTLSSDLWQQDAPVLTQAVSKSLSDH